MYCFGTRIPTAGDPPSGPQLLAALRVLLGADGSCSGGEPFQLVLLQHLDLSGMQVGWPGVFFCEEITPGHHLAAFLATLCALLSPAVAICNSPGWQAGRSHDGKARKLQDKGPCWSPASSLPLKAQWNPFI